MDRGDGFKGRQFAAEVILLGPFVGCLMFPISYRDLELMLLDRGVEVDHTTIFRWIQAYAEELEKRIRPHLRMSNGSWRVDETYVRVKGRLDGSLSGGGQPRADDRLPVGCTARYGCGEAVLPQGASRSRTPSIRARSPVEQEPRLSKGGRGDEERRRTLAPFSSPAMQVSEESCRAGSSAHQASRPTWARLRRVPNRPKNIGRFRSDGDDPEGADSRDSADAISEDRRSSLPLFSIPPHKGDRIQFIPVLPSSAIVFATEPKRGCSTDVLLCRPDHYRWIETNAIAVQTLRAGAPDRRAAP